MSADLMDFNLVPLVVPFEFKNSVLNGSEYMSGHQVAVLQPFEPRLARFVAARWMHANAPVKA